MATDNKIPYTYPTLLSAGSLYALASEVVKMFQRIALAHNEPAFGSTGARPTLNLVPGQQYWDSDLKQPIWWDADAALWRDASGAGV